MIQKFEFYLNILHYCIFKFLGKFSLFIDKINPLMYLEKIPIIKKNFEKNNTNLSKVVNEVWLNEERGFNVMYSTAFTAVIIYFYMFFIFLLINLVIGLSWEYVFYLAILPSYAIYYIFINKNGKYISYFKNFNKFSKVTIRKYALISFFFFALSIILFSLSFKLI